MVNKVTLIGNLGADPDVRRLEGGATVAKLRVATNESYKDKDGNWQDRTEWHSVIAWRTLAERAEQIKKGTLLYIEGKLTTRKWQDKDGNDRYTTEVVANYLRVLNKRDGSSAAGGNGYFPSANDAPSTAQTAKPAAVAETDMSASADDDLPF